MKYIYAIILILLLNIGAAAADVYLDGKDTDIDAQITQGVSLVPMRALFEELGFSVTWNAAERRACADNNEISISFFADSNIMYKNGYAFTMPQSAKLLNGTTYVPLRPAAEQCGIGVTWNGEADRVILSNGIYDDDELYWLSRIIHAEAMGESLSGKISVGNVVLNRVASQDFPSNIYDVIFDTQYGVQFTPVANGSIYAEPMSESIEAAKLALDRYSVVGDCLYFVNPVLSPNSWASQNRPFYKKIGNHDFFC